jgi:hypothetical protein
MKPYSGALDTPFDELKLAFGAVLSQASIDRVRKQIEQRQSEKTDKLYKLCDHFEIDRNDPQKWFRLSLALAEKHVRGFQERRKPGAKTKWTPFRKWELKLAVDQKINEAGKRGGTSVTWVCRILAKQEPWKTLATSNKPVEVLRRTYQEVCRDIKKAEQRPASTQK